MARREAELLQAAERAREHAYAPYSNFAVGAAVLAGSGRIFSAANVENASYGLSMCAERSAIFQAISAGERHIEAVAVYVEGDQPAMPCGACRQVIQEFAARSDISIIVAGEGGREVLSLGELLPRPFRL